MKKIYVTKSSLPPFEEYVKEIESIWSTHLLTNMGEKHNNLEQELCNFLKVDNISLFTNGHLALEMALQAAELEGEVITTPFTFASTTHAIVRNGLSPIFCDIKRDTCVIDEDKIEPLITEKTSAILPVHVYGNICNVEKIQKIANKHSLKVIYDAAHAFGVEYKSQGIAQYGDMSMFSLHATKVFNTIEGGAISCNDADYMSKLYNLKNFGIKDAEHVIAVGGNAKMNEFQAAMGLCNLKYLSAQINARKLLVNVYEKELNGIEGIRVLTDKNSDIKQNYAYMPVYFDSAVLGVNRDEIANKLQENFIIPRKYFYPLTSEFDCYKKQSPDCECTTPIAKHMSENVLTLPLYPDLQSQDVLRICDIIKSC